MLKMIEPSQCGEKRTEVIGNAEPKLMIGVHKPTIPTTDDLVFDVIEMLLTNGRTSRLYKKLVQEKQLATSVSAFSAPGSRYPNLFIIDASPRAPTYGDGSRKRHLRGAGKAED